MKPALLLVDLQEDFLAAPALSPPRALLIRNAGVLLESCRARQIPVIHVGTTVRRDSDRRLAHWRRQDRWMCVAGTPGHQTPASLKPLRTEAVLHKTGFNPFNGQIESEPNGGTQFASLESHLQSLGIDTVILAGLHLHACIRTAAAECLERGWSVRIPEDAVASHDPVHAASVRRWLAERCVVFESTAALLAELDGLASSLVHRAPGTGEVLFELTPVAAPAMASAVNETAQVWQEWREISQAARRRMLDVLADRLVHAAPELARQMAIDIGKPLQHGFEEVRRAAENIRDVHRRAADPRSFREQGGLVRRVPCGVIALITPWNNPVAIALGKIAPALAYGNVVVWKPAPAATRIAQTLLSLLLEAGVPHGAVCLLPGDHRAALELIAQDSIDAVTFTGSRSAGYAVQERCARRLVPLQAELIGNNAAIVWTDGDLSPAALEVARGAFGFAGQRCTANRRAIVPASRVEEFAHELKRAGEQLAWGDPLDPAVEIGPMINTEQRDRATALIESERARVRRIEYLHAARAREPWTRRGAWMQPVIVCCDAADSLLAQEEMMAPVLVVQGARDFDHAIDLCNGVRHGLAAALFSDNADLQRRFLADARAGILKLNASTAGADVTLPFGGWKESGCGPPEHGEGDVLFYTRLQAVYGMPTQAGHNGAQQLRALTP